MIRKIALVVLALASLTATASAGLASQPLFEGLGPQDRKVTTSSPEALKYFRQGLAFLSGFNHDEAIRSFEAAGAIDPDCAMAWWGVSLAYGPHINNTLLPPDRAKKAWEALQKARAAKATPVEAALIDALSRRYADPPPEDRTALDRAYADAMRKVWRQFPKDGDVGALFAESLMDLRPWELFSPDGRPAPETPEILETLETVIKRHPKHALALHLYIHALEMSPAPEKAEFAADRLRDLAPGLGHLVHMPSHIDVRLGRWQEAFDANTKAEEADRIYRAQSPNQGFYRLYMSHNHHMRAFAAMMIGLRREAVSSIDRMVEEMPADWARENTAIADGFLAMPYEVRMRFGLWEDILALPIPDRAFPIARTLSHYARGAAFAATGRLAQAHAERAAFLVEKKRVGRDAIFGNNRGADIVAVAERLLEGEILYHSGKKDRGIAELRKGVALEDRLRYDEPPDWIQPVRHALGAALVQSGRFDEAETVFREDLKKHPENGWSLFGLAQSLRVQGKKKEAAEAEARFKKVWEKSDVALRSACFCQPGI